MKIQPKIRLRPGVIDFLLTEHDTNLTGLVAILHVNSTQIWRLRQGGNVGERVIANLLATHPKKQFEDFFFVA